MTRETAQRSGERNPDREFWVGAARAFGAAIIFALPLLMTMEMWWLGFYMDRLRLVLLIVVMYPLLIGLDYFLGFRETSSLTADAIDALVAYGIGYIASVVILLLFRVIGPGATPSDVIGQVSLQAVPASFGAVLAASQLAGGLPEEELRDAQRRKEEAGYAAQLLFMAAGAMFLAFNVAPTEEMVLIAYQMSPWHVVALAMVSLALVHGFLFALKFRGQASPAPDEPGWELFLRHTAVGYALSLAISAYVLWTFGRFDGNALETSLAMSIVLGFPASLGAAAGRLIL